MRPNSIYCLYQFNQFEEGGGDNNKTTDHESSAFNVSTINDAKRLLYLPHSLFTSTITKTTIRSEASATNIICQNFDTIVVTDDVFLRQRIINSGGYVMTFEQLWDLLQ